MKGERKKPEKLLNRERSEKQKGTKMTKIKRNETK